MQLDRAKALARRIEFDAIRSGDGIIAEVIGAGNTTDRANSPTRPYDHDYELHVRQQPTGQLLYVIDTEGKRTD